MASAMANLAEDRRALEEKREHIADVLRRAGLRAEATRHDGFGLCVVATTSDPRGGEYVAQIVRGSGHRDKEGIRVRWVPNDGNPTSLGTVETPARVAGLMLDHHHLLP